jgi:rubredoxin
MSDHRSRKITLPGGREIEVVYLGEVPPSVADSEGWTDLPGDSIHDALGAAFTAFDQLPAELWVCDDCGGDLVRPLALEECQDGLWRVERLCPDCGARHEGGYGRVEVEDFHDAIEEGTEELLSALRQMTRLNMEHDVELLIEAIRDDRIQPIDF